MLAATSRTALSLFLIPRACPVVSHARSYFKYGRESLLHTTGASPWYREVRHWWLVAASMSLHGASPWYREVRSCCSVAASMSLHGASPWYQQTGLFR